MEVPLSFYFGSSGKISIHNITTAGRRCRQRSELTIQRHGAKEASNDQQQSRRSQVFYFFPHWDDGTELIAKWLPTGKRKGNEKLLGSDRVRKKGGAA